MSAPSPSPSPIRDLRKRLGCSQRQFGQLVGCTQPEISRLESGTDRPSAKLRAALTLLEWLVSEGHGEEILIDLAAPVVRRQDATSCCYDGEEVTIEAWYTDGESAMYRIKRADGTTELVHSSECSDITTKR